MLIDGSVNQPAMDVLPNQKGFRPKTWNQMAHLGEGGRRFFGLVGWCSLWPLGMGCATGSAILTYSKTEELSL